LPGLFPCGHAVPRPLGTVEDCQSHQGTPRILAWTLCGRQAWRPPPSVHVSMRPCRQSWRRRAPGCAGSQDQVSPRAGRGGPGHPASVRTSQSVPSHLPLSLLLCCCPSPRTPRPVPCHPETPILPKHSPARGGRLVPADRPGVTGAAGVPRTQKGRGQEAGTSVTLGRSPTPPGPGSPVWKT
jgi:hypothetical protein